MTLAPIRGAPPGAAIPGFPVEEGNAASQLPTETPASCDQRQLQPGRKPHTPLEISADCVTLAFRVIPEQPAIARASMTIQVTSHTEGQSATCSIGSLRMSAGDARRFLTDLLAGRSPIVITGDEGGTVEIEAEHADAAWVFTIRKLAEQSAFCHLTLDQTFDILNTANQLLLDLGD